MKFHGKVGFALGSVETKPGIWEQSYDEKTYYGDFLKDSRNWEKSESINDNLIVTNRISILADQYAYKNLGAMRYIELYGKRWSIRSVEINRPRLVLTLGGVFTDEQA